MPLTAEQKAAIETLKGVTAEDAEEFRNELQTANNAVVHHIYRRGFTEAESRWKPRAETAEAKVTEAETAKAEAERKLQEAEGKQPDVAKIHADWQKKYDADIATRDQQLEGERTARKTEREARKISDLRAHLTGLDPEYARFKASEAAGRLHVKDDGTVELREPGSEVPVNVPAGKTPHQVLAEEIVRAAPAALRTSNADTGGGVDGGGGGGKPTPEEVRKATEGTVNYTI
jgi:hypothetical protein